MLREYGLDPQPIRELLKATVTRVYQNTWAACAYRGICAIPDTIFGSHKIYQKRLSNVQSIRGPEFYKALELIRKDKLDSFVKLLDEEMDSQWDRIIDRRFFNIVSNLSFVALGFILGRL